MLLLIDKPKGITSHDVVDKVRKITGERRVGHAGTLDPLATGLLIVGVGREFTKKLGDLTKNTDKTYLAEITLGATSDTDDAEGNITLNTVSKPLEYEDIRHVIEGFEGEQTQVPPAFSAIKLKGKKAYELARKGKQLDLESRKITIYNLSVLNFNYPILQIECRVSSGTYIRALARDIGETLGVGAYLSNLRRTKIGQYSVAEAKTLEQLQELL